MKPGEGNARLSQIMTHWEGVFKAHAPGDEASRALGELAERYLPAIYNYIRGTVRNDHDADDLTQKFAMRLVEGKFSKASPERGRFRDLIRTAVRNLITDHFRTKGMPVIPQDMPEPATGSVAPAADFDQRWGEETLNRVWDALREYDETYHTVLRMKSDSPELRSAQIAERLTRQTGKVANEAGVRKTLQRAREKFSELLLTEIGRSIGTDDLSAIEQELLDLGLYEYCKPEIEKRRGV